MDFSAHSINRKENTWERSNAAEITVIQRRHLPETELNKVIKTNIFDVNKR